MFASVGFFCLNCAIIKSLSLAGEVAATTVNAYRFLVGLGVAAVIFARGGPCVPLAVVTHPMLILRGVSGAVALLLFYYTLYEMSLGRASVINLTYTLFAAVLAALFLGERSSLRQCIGIAVAFAGVVGVCGAGITGGFSLIDGIAVAGAFFAGISVIAIRQLRRTHKSPTIHAAQSFWGLLVVVPFLFGEALVPSLLSVVLMVTAGLFSAGGQLMLTSAFRQLSVVEGSTIQLLVPVGNTIVGALVFAEVYTVLELFSGFIVLAGCLVVVRSRPSGA